MDDVPGGILLLLLFSLLAIPARAQEPPTAHPDTTEPGWTPLFEPDLSNAIYPEGVWLFDDGVLTAREDREIWTRTQYDDFVLDLEFRTAPGTNSGVIIHASRIENWVPYSVEIQIADDHHETWAAAPATWQGGAIFGHAPPKRSTVKEPGAWNRLTITAIGQKIRVVLNGALVNAIDMDRWTSATTNPDGSEIPAWLSVPLAELPHHGHIGLQGKHGEAPIWFRNIKIRVLD